MNNEAIILKGHENCDENNCYNIGDKCRVIAGVDDIPSFAIDDYYFYEVDNIKEIGVRHRDKYGWDIICDINILDSPEEYYFCIDGIYNEAWAHWVDESALFLVLFDKLKLLYPKLKIYSFTKKGYKDAMYRAFNIDINNIVYTIESKRNKFIFPQYESLANHRRPFLFYNHMNNFYNYIVQRCEAKEKDIDILYLPRGEKENQKSTDRIVPIQDDLIELLSNIPSVKIYYSDQTTNMIDQWNLVRRAKIIILNDGSNLLVNGYFAINSHIIVIGGHGNWGHLHNPSPGLLYYDSIKRGNRYYHLNNSIQAGIIFKLISSIEDKTAIPETVPPISCWRNCNYCKYQDYSKFLIIS